MNTFLKIAIGFVSGIICTILGLYIIGMMQNSEELQLREEVRISALKSLKNCLDNTEESEITEGLEITNEDESPKRNIQSFELSTKKGIVKLHTYMPKDSVKMRMGRPHTTSIRTYGDDVHEKWEYEKKVYDDMYTTEFSFEFVNGELKSVYQY
ncbi:MAG: hypothetical protein IJW01_05330 [Paludibacteraceae bacterium]|nr:hypothetical protein [Paludibacteraceae bacterium]